MGNDDFKTADAAVSAIQFLLKLLELILRNEEVDESFPSHDIVNKFVKETHQAEVANVKAILDPVQIATFRQVVNASVKSPTLEQQKEAENRLVDFLKANNELHTNAQFAISRQEAFNSLLRLRDVNDWTFRFKKNGVSVWTKQAEYPLIKCSLKIKQNVKVCFDLIREFESTHETKSTKAVVQLVQKYDENHSDWYFYSLFSFPFQPRDFVLTRWFVFDPNQSIIFEHSTTRPEIPPKSKVVRGNLFAAGHILTPDKENPQHTLIESYNQIDFKMNMPQWMLSSHWKQIWKYLKHFKAELKKRVKTE